MIRNTITPNLQTLEARDCPSATVIVSSNTLYITSDPASDQIQLRDNGKGRVDVFIRSHDGVTGTTGYNIDRIVMHLRGSADTVDYKLTAPLTRPLDIRMDLGTGTGDKVSLDLSKGIRQGAVVVDVRGSIGQGSVQTKIGTIDGGFAVVHPRFAGSHQKFQIDMPSDASSRSRVSVS